MEVNSIYTHYPTGLTMYGIRAAASRCDLFADAERRAVWMLDVSVLPVMTMFISSHSCYVSTLSILCLLQFNL